MTDFKFQKKSQKAGVISELIILLLMPWAQLIRLLISFKWQELTENERIYLLVSSGIFIFGCIGQIFLALLKNTKRKTKLRKTFRLMTLIFTIVNIVENQIINWEYQETITQKASLPYSFLGVCFMGAIQSHQFQKFSFRKTLILITAMYFSLRISFKNKDYILPIYTSLLCLIFVIYIVWIKKLKRVDKNRNQIEGKNWEDSLLRFMLSTIDEGFIVLQNNHYLNYINPSVYNILDFSSGDLIKGLGQIKQFSGLDNEEQQKIRVHLFENHYVHNITEENSPHSKNTGRTRTQLLQKMPSESSSCSSTISRNYGLGPNSTNRDKNSSRFKPAAKNNNQTSLDSSMRIKYQQQKLSPFGMSLFNPNFSHKKSKLKDTRGIFRNEVTIGQIGKIKQENCSYMNTEDQINNETSFYSVKEHIEKNETKFTPTAIQISKEKYIFKGGIPKNLHQLFYNFKLEHDVQVINCASTLDDLATSLKDLKNYALQCKGYIHNEDSKKIINIKAYPLSLNGQSTLILQLKDSTEKEYAKFLNTSDEERTNSIALASHELRTPLNCIITMLDLVEKSVSDELWEDYLQPASHSAKLLLSLVNDILDFSQYKAKKLKLNYTNFNLKRNLKDIIKLMDLQIKAKGLELEFVYDERVPKVICSEPNRIRQIVINLIGNSSEMDWFNLI